MIQNNLDFQKAIYLVDSRIKPQHLNKIQEIILIQSLEGKTYSQIASEYNYDMEYIKTSGSELWKLLTKAFGEQIRKNNCTPFIRRRILESTSKNTSLVDTIKKTHTTFSEQEINNISLIASGVPNFQGRERELTQFKSWSHDPNCRFIMIKGMTGCGKTTLAAKTAEVLKQDFYRVISLPVSENLKVKNLIEFCLHSLEPNLEISSDINKLLVDLAFYLQKYRCLLILDDLDSIFELKRMIPHYRSNCEQYAAFLRCLINTRHQSLVVATSRIDLKQLDYYGSSDNLKLLSLEGLESDILWSIFENEISQDISQNIWERICNYYRKNPELIKIIVRNLSYLPISDTNIYKQYYPSLEEVDYIIENELKLLDKIGKEVLYYLAFSCNNNSLDRLLYSVSHPRNKVLKVLDAIQDTFLMKQDNYVLQPMFKHYLQRHLVKTAMANDK
ncbi:NB-ARC domain protein [Hyella patelloides LEGE 07179]|uniref:NB-ARC domain protein n=1 Tax=Hyella patelloides LEGE 07179 TaxID=945734 RepID=A0A563VX35_9CYAN|nr:ATP-binding protein [Hyella patelloides]VEP15947.1 NB-ARC domain protein [Hyella patelloides LEGE 07179]